MAVTHGELIDLSKLTVLDLPLPSVADMLCVNGPGDDEAATILAFIKLHYTKTQIRDGITEYLRRVDLVESIFGGNSDNQE